MLIMVDRTGEPLEEARIWISLARLFLRADSYQRGERMVDTLGAEAALALSVLLRRLSSRTGGRDALACVEASDILRGRVEEVRGA